MPSISGAIMCTSEFRWRCLGAVALCPHAPVLVWFWSMTGWLITGPVFIFLGNLPPNPHAVAILEAAYLMPDLFFLLLVAAGTSLCFRTPCFLDTEKWLLAGILLMLVAWHAPMVFQEVNQRHNFIAVDYIRNTYRSLPAPSLIVGRSDVPLFSLYYGHWISPRAPGRVPVAQGFAASAWYQTMLQRDESGTLSGPAKNIRGLGAVEAAKSRLGAFCRQ